MAIETDADKYYVNLAKKRVYNRDAFIKSCITPFNLSEDDFNVVLATKLGYDTTISEKERRELYDMYLARVGPVKSLGLEGFLTHDTVDQMLNSFSVKDFFSGTHMFSKSNFTVINVAGEALKKLDRSMHRLLNKAIYRYLKAKFATPHTIQVLHSNNWFDLSESDLLPSLKITTHEDKVDITDIVLVNNRIQKIYQLYQWINSDVPMTKIIEISSVLGINPSEISDTEKFILFLEQFYVEHLSRYDIYFGQSNGRSTTITMQLFDRVNNFTVSHKKYHIVATPKTEEGKKLIKMGMEPGVIEKITLFNDEFSVLAHNFVTNLLCIENGLSYSPSVLDQRGFLTSTETDEFSELAYRVSPDSRALYLNGKILSPPQLKYIIEKYPEDLPICRKAYEKIISEGQIIPKDVLEVFSYQMNPMPVQMIRKVLENIVAKLEKYESFTTTPEIEHIFKQLEMLFSLRGETYRLIHSICFVPIVRLLLTKAPAALLQEYTHCIGLITRSDDRTALDECIRQRFRDQMFINDDSKLMRSFCSRNVKLWHAIENHPF
jgi:hypothetical protein